MSIKSVLIAAITLGSAVAFAADGSTTGRSTETPSSMGKPTAQGAGDTMMAKDYWKKHSKEGSMTKEDALQFKGADGKKVSMDKLDTNQDGKVSEQEWTSYNDTAGAVGTGNSGKAGDTTDSKSK